MKKILCILAMIALALALTDKEIIQQGLNGLYEQNKFPDPTTIVPCIDDTSAHQIVVFAGQLLDKAAKGSLSDIYNLPDFIRAFGDSLNPAVGQCLDGNAELDALAVKYGVQGVDSHVIEKKVLGYVALHFLSVHKWLVDLDDTWHAGNYYQVGFKAAGYGHNVLGLSSLQLSDKEIIQQLLNGVFEQNKLPDPTTIVPCIDDTSAHQIVVFGGQLLDKAAKGSLSDYYNLPDFIRAFGDSLNPAVGQCLSGNAEFDALAVKYGVKDVDSHVIEKKVLAYAALHFLSVHKWLVDLDDTWHAGNYYQVGFKGAGYGHNVLGINNRLIKLRREAI